MALESVGTDALGVAHSDHPALDPPEVHLPQRDPDGVLGTLELPLGHVLEHVLGREGELLLGLHVLGLLGDEPVDLLHVTTGEADHRVDNPHVPWRSQGCSSLAGAAGGSEGILLPSGPAPIGAY